jgi:hypothetical protein
LGQNDLQSLFKLYDEKYRIIEMHFSWDKEREPQTIIDLKLQKDNKIIDFSSSEETFIAYAIHLHSLPHVNDDGSDFVYIEDAEKYFALQKMIIDLFSGKQKKLIISQIEISENKYIPIITKFLRNWILAEKGVYYSNTRIAQIFFDVGILFIKGSKVEFKLFCKEKVTINDIYSIIKESQNFDFVVCFSAFILGPKKSDIKTHKSGTIAGLIIYDLKIRRTLSFNINGIEQLLAHCVDVGKFGLWESIDSFFNRNRAVNCFESSLPLPLNDRYTPLPWFCYTFLKDIQISSDKNIFTIDLPLFIAFGAPLVFSGKPSYSFDKENQVAFLMLSLKQNDELIYFQVRFDMSEGEPNLHLDFQMYPASKKKGLRTKMKLIGHKIIDFQEIIDFNENLGIGFLLASAYDVKFDTVVIPEKISGITEALRKNPLNIYPLFVRSIASTPFKEVRKDNQLIDGLHSMAKGEIIEENLVKRLESLGLVKENGLTILGDIVHTRLTQTK